MQPHPSFNASLYVCEQNIAKSATPIKFIQAGEFHLTEGRDYSFMRKIALGKYGSGVFEIFGPMIRDTCG